jgi:arylsulfatase A-like enzyme
MRRSLAESSSDRSTLVRRPRLVSGTWSASRRWLALGAVAAQFASGAMAAQTSPGDAGARIRLVVHLSVDQLRPEYLEAFRPQFTAGWARLLTGAAYFPNGFQDHGITETAPGHSTMMSGRFPRSTGIVANDAGVLDVEFPLIGAAGDPASPYRFRGTVLGDWLRFRDPRSRLLSVSRKDRSAILPLGRAKGEAYWYAPRAGIFTTSRWYADTLPAWVQRFNARRLPQSHAGTVWTLLLPEGAYPEPDSVPFESLGRNFTFPHRLPVDTARAVAALVDYPMMDEITLQLALEGVRVRELGADTARTDFLAVSLSSTDGVGHKYGPDSRELHDHMLRLDRYLGAFLDSLYRMRDSSTIVFSLTADHGVAPYPDSALVTRYRTAPAGRVNPVPIVRALRDSLSAARVDPRGFLWDQGVLYLDPVYFRRAAINRDSVARSFARAVGALPGVLRAELYADLVKKGPAHDAITRRWLQMFPDDLPVAVVVTLRPYWYYQGWRDASHGTPHDYDARVPVMFFGAGIRPGRHEEAVRVVDIAPTLAALLQLRPMERLDGRALTRAIR